MRKLNFFSLFALIVFSATVWAAETEGPWTYVGMRSGTCDQSMNNSIAYNNLDNSHWGTVTFWNYDNNGIGFVVQGSSKNNTKNAVYSLYSLTKTIPSYSRCQITWQYQVKGQNVKHYSRTTLYEHTNQSTLQGLAVDFKTDKVTLHYTGKHIDGSTFDSSVDRGEPATFPVNAVVPGFKEMLMMMRPGAKAHCIIPGNLGYGDQGNEVIGPNEVLVFDIETIALAK